MKWLVLALAFVMLACAAPGDDTDDARRCASIDDDPKLKIQHCTRAIDAGDRSSGKLEIAHFERGSAYTRLGQFDRAISDYDTAIRINPNYANAYNSRGFTHAAKRHNDRIMGTLYFSKGSKKYNVPIMRSLWRHSDLPRVEERAVAIPCTWIMF